jgi:hypothetical protein
MTGRQPLLIALLRRGQPTGSPVDVTSALSALTRTCAGVSDRSLLTGWLPVRIPLGELLVSTRTSRGGQATDIFDSAITAVRVITAFRTGCGGLFLFEYHCFATRLH